MMEGLIRPIVLVKGFAGFGKILSNGLNPLLGQNFFAFKIKKDQLLTLLI